MEKDDFLEDDFLKKVIQNLPEDSPSDDFVLKVMSQILPEPEAEKAEKPFFLILSAAWPYVLISLALLLFLVTSDLPLSNVIPGKEYFAPYFSGMIGSFRIFFEKLGDLTMLFMVAGAAVMLYFVDMLFTLRKVSGQATV